jgi:hypothetical protein
MPSLEPEYGVGYLDPWGFITHAETVSITQSVINSGSGAEFYRRRGFTHTLTVNGVLQFSDQQGTIRFQKDRLVRFIELMKEDPSNFNLPINAGFFPSIVIDPSQAIFEPTNVNFEGGTLIDNARYEVQFVFQLFPAENEIEEIEVFGIGLWDGSAISINVQFDRSAGTRKSTTTISASISCPTNMPWEKALIYYDRVLALEDNFGDNILMSVQADKNFDAQTVSYNITGDTVEEEGDKSATIELFGFDWSIHGSLQITNNVTKVPVDVNEDKNKVINDSEIPYIETLTYGISVSAPGDVGLLSPNEGPGLPPVTLLDMYANARSIRPGQYKTGLKNVTTEVDDWAIITDPKPNELWEIIDSNASFDANNKSLSVNITAKRARETAIRKNFGFVGSEAFLWDGVDISYSNSGNPDSFISTITVGVIGNIQTPDDMTPKQAQDLIDEMLALPDFDERYRSYKLVNSTGNYNPHSQSGVFNLSFQKTDIYSFFDENGSPRIPRSCLWGFGIFDDVPNLQVEVTYSQNANTDEDGNNSTDLSIDLSIRQNPNTFVELSSTIEQAFEELWQRFVVNQETLNNGIYRFSNGRRNFTSRTLEGQMNLNFTDDGEGDGQKPNIVFYGIIISNPKYNFKLPRQRFSSNTDGFSHGDFAQKHGFDLMSISLSGKIKGKNYDTIQPPVNEIYASSEYRDGFLIIAGYIGRLTDININPDPTKRTADVSFSIEVQPTNSNGLLKEWNFTEDNLGAVAVGGEPPISPIII